jgi:chorismate mutase-like protein
MRALLARGLLAAVAVAAVAASASVAASPAAATEYDRLAPARQVLSLTDDRLALMRGVMATKWAARTPIEDLAQEATVLAGARAAAAEHELQPDGVEGLFGQQILAAKEVQLGWGGAWLMHGFPADEPVPDLAAVRAELAAIGPEIVDALVHMPAVHCARNLRARLLRVADRRITTPYVTDERRAAIVGALLDVRPAGGLEPCPAPRASGS